MEGSKVVMSVFVCEVFVLFCDFLLYETFSSKIVLCPSIRLLHARS